VLALVLVLALTMAAQAQYRPSVAKQTDTQTAVDGEVQGVRMVNGNVYMVLIEWPVTIRLTTSTVFTTYNGLPLSISGATSLLAGQAVRVFPRMSSEGEIVADKVEVLEPKELTRLRAERPERMAPEVLPNKDARPQPHRGRR
jgi:hypothetical protein